MMLPRYVGRGDHGCRDVRFFRLLDLRGVGKVGGIVHEDRPCRPGALIRYWTDGRGEDDGHLELALEPLLDDLQVQQPEEPAAEAVPERNRGILLIDQRGVVELELRHGLHELLVVVGVHRVDRGEDDGLDLPESGKRARRRDCRCP